MECLKYAHENGCPWDASVLTAGDAYGLLPDLKPRIACIQYAIENGCPTIQPVKAKDPIEDDDETTTPQKRLAPAPATAPTSKKYRNY